MKLKPLPIRHAGASVPEWIVIRTQWQKEKVAKLDLETLPVVHSTYMPMARYERRRKNGLLVEHLRPLLTSYLFVEVELANRAWEALLYRPWVKQVVGWRDGQDHPLVVRLKDMEELRRTVASYGEAVPIGLSRPKYIPPHTVVMILEGPFRDLPATVVADKGSRIDVLLELFGRKFEHSFLRGNIGVAVR